METVARHPLAALAAVAALVALALHFGISPPPPPRPEPPPPPTIDVLDASIGESMEYSGRVASVEFGTPPANAVLVLVIGRRETICSFPPASPGEASTVTDVRAGDAVTVRGCVERCEAGRVYLSGCKLVPGRSREALP